MAVRSSLGQLVYNTCRRNIKALQCLKEIVSKLNTNFVSLMYVSTIMSLSYLMLDLRVNQRDKVVLFILPVFFLSVARVHLF